MKYRDLYDKVEQAGSFHIEHLALIILDTEVRSDALSEILRNMDTEQFVKLFPKVKELSWFKGIEDFDNEGFIELLTDIDKLGFIAEIGVHQKYDFIFNKDGNFSSCSVLIGVSYPKLVYGDTIDELIESIEKVCDESEEKDIERFKKKKQKN